MKKIAGKGALVAALLAGGVLMAGGIDGGAVSSSSGYRTGGFIGVKGSMVFSVQSSIVGLGDGSYLDDSFDGSGAAFGVHLGGQEGQWRAILGYEYFDNDDNQNYDLFSAEVDYFFIENPGAFQPYIGIVGGYLNYETSNAEDSGGFAYGGTAGVTIPLNQNFDIDFGLRYMFATQDEVDHIGSVNFSVNYFY
ncbi:MAG: hypothetical protein GXO39_03720 [Thermotogae bacterium]|nr:hypothetical protein [Thermotogota bacterium]